MNLILATHTLTQQKFLLASAHGHSTRSADARLQIQLIMQKFHELNIPGLQVVIGIDANTKTEKDVYAFRSQLDQLGLIATDVGPTTVKKRMVTTQHSKAGRYVVDEEDYLITLKPEQGGMYQLTRQTLGFCEERADPNVPLPNLSNPSDHYPVGATLTLNEDILQ